MADGVLASVGALLREMTPKGCVAARWEESDFLVLCPGLGRADATGLLQLIFGEIRDLEHKDPKGETFRVTASGGVVEISSGSSFDDAVEDGYSLLKEALTSGGNTLAETAGPAGKNHDTGCRRRPPFRRHPHSPAGKGRVRRPPFPRRIRGPGRGPFKPSLHGDP